MFGHILNNPQNFAKTKVEKFFHIWSHWTVIMLATTPHLCDQMLEQKVAQSFQKYVQLVATAVLP